MMASAAAFICLLMASVGCLYLVCATVVAARFASEAPLEPASSPPVTILKPLKGDEPALFENLASFCTQIYPAPVQLVFGVQDAKDDAIPVVQRLKASFPDLDAHLVIDRAVHGTNLKISNLINMMPTARHQCIVLADSDIGVPPDYLSRVTAALEQPGVGGVTCLYHGIAVAGFWSKLSALAIDGHFLPNVLVGLRSGLARPCFGSTIALRRSHLDEIGGFEAFSDCLADDYAIGAALRAEELRVVVPRLLLGHSCAESSLAEMWRHELRWARTIRTVDPSGYAGSLVTHPLAFALLAFASGASAAGPALAILAILGRIVLLQVTARSHGLAPAPYWLVPIRDLLSFAIFVWSFCGRDLTWRGRNYHVRANGTLTAD
ncbi:ceramide glucosyltransferase [Rhizobiales bacterium GAS191]|jgi:ceramide glucosyltransferase|nr:ceramide glucosyltransferase [Rhizobiales bacterium GAS188]SED15834.1 ceramide glucosyltransferase [Rhizobiales bacterium GAS191]